MLINLRADDTRMGLIVILVLLVVLGPLAVRFGVDSRPVGERQEAWWPGAPRR